MQHLYSNELLKAQQLGAPDGLKRLRLTSLWALPLPTAMRGAWPPNGKVTGSHYLHIESNRMSFGLSF